MSLSSYRLYKHRICPTKLVAQWALWTLILSCSALFSNTPHVYVTNFNGGSISIIDPEDDFVENIFGFSNPRAMKIAPNGLYGYVGENSNHIRIFDTSTNTVLPIAIHINHPVALAISPDGKFVFVISNDNTINVISTFDSTIQKQISGFDNPQDIKITPDGKFIYVTNAGNNTVSIVKISEASIVDTISGFHKPLGLTFSIDGAYAFVTNADNDSLSVISVSDHAIVSELSELNHPRYLTVSPDGKYIYVANFGNNVIEVIRIADGIITCIIPVQKPLSLAITPDNKYLYASSDSTTILKIRLSDHAIVKTFEGFKSPTNIAIAFTQPPCSHVNGYRIGEMGENEIKYYNKISWNAAPETPINYKIFRDPELTNLVGETTDLIFIDDHRNGEQADCYYILAEYANGFSSTIGHVTISP